MKTEIEINAEKLYSFLKENGPAWEDKCLKMLFPPVPWSQDTKKEYYEYLTAKYGSSHYYIINGEEFKVDAIPYEKTYCHKLHLAYQHLKKQNKAGERNNGFNEYVFYAI